MDGNLEDEMMDTVNDMPLPFTKELINEIRDRKAADPQMFVSAWEEDDAGVEKNVDDPAERFLTAAEEGDLGLVTSILEENPAVVKAHDADGYTALHRACYNNHLEVVKYLLSHGADVEAKTNDGWTPLLSAANWANYEVIGCLLSAGADANAISNGKVSSLHLAINSQAEDPESVFHTVRFLLQAPGIDASVVSGSGDTPLMLARRSSERLYDLINDFLER